MYGPIWGVFRYDLAIVSNKRQYLETWCKLRDTIEKNHLVWLRASDKVHGSPV